MLDSTLTNLLLLACAGLTVVITMSHVGAPLRNLFPPPIGSRGVCPTKPKPALLCCPLCTGFWVGLGVGVGSWPIQAHHLPWFFYVPVFAFAAAVVAYIAGTWLHEHDK